MPASSAGSSPWRRFLCWLGWHLLDYELVEREHEPGEECLLAHCRHCGQTWRLS